MYKNYIPYTITEGDPYIEKTFPFVVSITKHKREDAFLWCCQNCKYAFTEDYISSVISWRNQVFRFSDKQDAFMFKLINA
jgi:hypothetical protein